MHYFNMLLPQTGNLTVRRS